VGFHFFIEFTFHFNIYRKQINKKMAAPAKQSSVSVLHKKPKKKRAGVHSKKNASSLKTSKNYKKLYRGQGKG